MITSRGKWIALAAAILLLAALAAGEALWGGRTTSPNRIGGVSLGMPDESVELFLQGYFGLESVEYESFPDFESARMALDCGRVSAIWTADVTADYLKQEGPYISVGPAETPGQGQERFSFAFAFRREDEELFSSAEQFLGNLSGDEKKKVLGRFLFEGPYGHLNSIQHRRTDEKTSKDSDPETIRIGVTGAVPPLELIYDSDVSGSAVLLACNWARSIGREPEFVVLPAADAYINLLAGKVDLLAVSASSENHSLTETKYITTTGYLGVKEYRLVTREKGAESMGSWTNMIKDNLISGGAYRKILSAAVVTLGTTAAAWITAALLALLFLRMRQSGNRFLRGFAGGAAYIFRSVPALLLVLLLGFGLFGGSRLPVFLSAALGIGLYGAGLLTEAAGESAAGGCSEPGKFSLRAFLIFLGTKPARKIAVTVLQWTTVVSCLGVNDLAGMMQTFGRRTMFPVFAIVFSIAFYLVLTVLLERIPYTDGIKGAK